MIRFYVQLSDICFRRSCSRIAWNKDLETLADFLAWYKEREDIWVYRAARVPGNETRALCAFFPYWHVLFIVRCFFNHFSKLFFYFIVHTRLFAYGTTLNVQNEKQGILFLISGILAIQDEEFMPEDWFWGDCRTHFLPKFCGLRKAKKWRLSPPLVLPQPSLAPGGASVVTLATDDKRCKKHVLRFGVWSLSDVSWNTQIRFPISRTFLQDRVSVPGYPVTPWQGNT